MKYKMVVLGLCGGSAVGTIKGKNVKSDDMLTLSFSDFAPIDAKDTNGVRRTGLPDELSAEHIAESARKLDFLADRLWSFV